MELQAIVFGLLEELEFCPPASGELDEIEAVRAGGTTPFKKDKWKVSQCIKNLGYTTRLTILQRVNRCLCLFGLGNDLLSGYDLIA